MKEVAKIIAFILLTIGTIGLLLNEFVAGRQLRCNMHLLLQVSNNPLNRAMGWPLCLIMGWLLAVMTPLPIRTTIAPSSVVELDWCQAMLYL